MMEELLMKIESVLFARIFVLLGCFALAPPSSTVLARASGQVPSDLPRNVELTNAAWDAFKGKNYEAAITAADRCVRRFKDEAENGEAQLEKSHASLPPTGKVTDREKKAIFDQGVLNDVATCYWIKGSSAQALKRIDVAKDAFKATAGYRYARTWDVKGWFWSPSADALDRLEDLK
jgi:hypothetical protein